MDIKQECFVQIPSKTTNNLLEDKTAFHSLTINNNSNNYSNQINQEKRQNRFENVFYKMLKIIVNWLYLNRNLLIIFIPPIILSPFLWKSAQVRNNNYLIKICLRLKN